MNKRFFTIGYVTILEWLGDQWAGNATEGTDIGARYMEQVTILDKVLNA